MAQRRKGDAGGTTSHWLVKDGHVLASLEVAGSRWHRTRGLIGRAGMEGAMLLPHTKSVHTFGMRFGLDVAFLDDGNRVIKVLSLRPHRVSGFHVHAASVLEAEAGAFQSWGIEAGDELEITEECE
jgi:uncharacterized membrane protein (UPF0127 family)